MAKRIDVPNFGIVEFPDDMSDADITAAIKRNAMSYKQPDAKGNKSAGALTNLLAGAVKGASDIGTTLLTPVAAAANSIGGEGTMLTGAQRRKALGDAFREYSNPESVPFKVGELGADVAGTAGVGGVLAKGARMIPAIARMAPALPAALESGGMTIGDAAATTGREVLKNAATRAAGGAITGGASAGLVNPDDAATGALIGGLMPGIIRGAGEIGKGIKATIYDPLFNQDKIAASVLQRATGSEAKSRIAGLIGTKANTEGVNLTAGQATLDPALNAIEDTLRATNPGGALSRNAGNQRQVLSSAMRGLAQDDVALQAAKTARNDAADSLYQRSFDSDAMRRGLVGQSNNERARAAAGGIDQMIPITKGQIAEDLATPKLRELARRDMFKSAISEAKKLASNHGIDIGDPLTSLQGLHYIKLALDDMANPMARTSLGRNANSARASIASDLADELGKIAPLYGNAKTTFAQMSAPINQMEVGQLLANKLIPSTAGDVPASLNAASLATALRNPDQVARTATGFSGAKLANVLTPEQLAMVNGVNSDVSRIAEAMKLGAGFGSPTARRIAAGGYINDHITESAPTLSAIFGSLGGMPGVNYLTKGASTLGNMAGKRINAEIAAKLENALLNNPDELMRMMNMQMGGSQSPILNGLLSSAVVPVAATRAGLLAQ